VSSQVASSVNETACPSAGDCVGVGSYPDATGSDQAMVATETGGTWGQATQAALPLNAVTTAGQQSARLFSVVCTGAGSCVAGGQYIDTNDNYEPMVATETGGSWATAGELQLPTNATTTAGHQDSEVNSLACTSAGNCVAIGQYIDTSGNYQPMVATETGGAWTTATGLQLPANATTTTGYQFAALLSVACTSAGNCVAGGYYTDTSDSAFPSMLVTETNGVWGQAVELALPTNADPAAGTQNSEVNSIACTSAGDCVADGYYRDQNLYLQAMMMTETGGAWTQATEVGLPTNAAAGNPSGNLEAIACSSAGNCVASGSYEDSGGNYQALEMVENGGVWGSTTEATLPANATTQTGGQSADLPALACTSTGQCVAGGDYVDTNGDYRPMVIGSVAPLAVTTTSLPTATMDSAYSEQLAAIGGAGDYTWSVSAGSLPAGVTLNPTSGVISGKPKGVGRASFTITAADPGPPSQTASVSLSITVKPGPPPNTLITRSTVSSRHGSATFRFKASGTASRFQCALVKLSSKKHAKAPKPKYSRCASPKSYKHLKAGHFTFYTRAIGPGGTDHTPASHKFKIS
jgi:hypothetical protein